MSTRAQVRFATREDGVSFSEHPDKINAQFYVHSDGYPEGLGLDMAHSIAKLENSHFIINGWEIEELDTKHGDLEYIYYVWQAEGKGTWISIFEVPFGDSHCPHCGSISGGVEDQCIFVGDPHKLIEKYDEERD